MMKVVCLRLLVNDKIAEGDSLVKQENYYSVYHRKLKDNRAENETWI